MRKVIEADAIVKLVHEAAARITEHVNDHAAVPSLTKAEASALIREEGWSADDLGLEAEINWHDVDFEDAAYEVGSDTLIDAAVSNEGAKYVVKYALAAMDDDDRAALLATLTPAAKPDLAAIKAELRAEVEREVREALIAKLFGAAKEGV